MAIIPDTKDWTWVLHRPCPECGVDTSGFAREAVPGLIRGNGAAWVQVLRRPDVRQRREPDVWSPLEYACHVRDVYLLFRQRLELMLAEEHPTFANWDQDETAVRERYGEQDPGQVAPALANAAEAIAGVFETVTGAQWSRPARRSDGAQFTVDTLSRYLLHDTIHHLHDVAR